MKTLLVASEGGHLIELSLLAERLSLPGKRAWVTFDTPQSRSLLGGQEVHFAPFAGTRDLLGTARAAWWARGFLRGHRFDTVVSTGASIALAVLPLAARVGADCYYIESATRTEGPSVTGPPARAVPLHSPAHPVRTLGRSALAARGLHLRWLPAGPYAAAGAAASRRRIPGAA